VPAAAFLMIPHSRVATGSEWNRFSRDISPMNFLVPIRDFFLREFASAESDDPFINLLDCCVVAQFWNKPGACCALSERSSWI